MKIKVNLKELIETIVDVTVEHYVDEYRTDDRFQPSQKVRQIKNDCIDLMKEDLIRKLCNIFEDKSE